MDIGRELVQIKRKLAEVERAARLSHASLDNAAIAVTDSTGTVRGHIGLQPDGTLGLTAVNGPAPGAPSAPTVTPSIGGLRIAWDGTLADGSLLPADFDHVAVHVATSSGFTPSAATFVGTITRAGDGGMLPVTPLPYVAHYVVLTAVNTSAAASGPSSEVTATPLKIDGPDLTAGSVTAGTIAAGAVTADKLEAILQLVTRLVAGNPTGARVELNENGLRVYDGSGTLVIQFNSADGSAIFTGAITGSTISGSTVTGGVLQTATSGQRVILNEAGSNSFRGYNSSNVLVANIDANGIGLRGANGAVIRVNPGTTYPNIWLFNQANTNKAVIQATEPTTGDANLEQFCGTFSGSGYTDMVWRNYLARDAAITERLRSTTPATIIGGRTALNATSASIGFKNTDDTTQDTTLALQANLATLTGGRFNVTAPASANSVGYFEGDAAHTGNLLRLYRAGDKLLVDKDGNVTASGSLAGTSLAVTDTVWQTYTPTIAGQGTGTFTSRTGFYYKLGKLVYFQAEFVMNAAGSGTGTVTVTAPSNIYRTGSRQAFSCHTQSTTTSGAVMNGNAVALETGSGAVIDRISVSNDGTSNRDNVLNGANLLAGARVTINGWYREA